MARASWIALFLVAVVPAPASGAAARPDPALQLARRQLAHLHLRPPLSAEGYARDLFRTWLDPDGNGCDARQDSLRRHGRRVRVGARCRILGGVWVSPYDGRRYTVPRQLDIDHVVPLEDAWVSGAARWTAARRNAYANDQLVLFPVDRHDNRAKGARGPDRWRPPRRASWRWYGERWIAIKARYRLTVTRAERSALVGLLAFRVA
jgi:hypothetical protein